MPASTTITLVDELAEGFGRGHFSVGLRGAQDAVKRDNIVALDIASPQGFLHLVTSEYQRSETFSLDAQASFSMYSGRGSAKANFSRSVKITSTSVTLLMSKNVPTRRLRLYQPELTALAKEFLDIEGPENFIRRYGDVFLNEITFGGSLFISLRYEAGTVEKAEQIKLELSGGIGPVSGAAETESRVFEKLARSEVVFNAASFGYPHLPVAGAFRGSEDDKLKSLFAFFDNFEENVTRGGGVGTEMSFDLMPLEQAVGAKGKGMLDLKDQHSALRQALGLKEELSRRRQDVDYALANLGIFSETHQELLQHRDWIDQHIYEVEEFAGRLFADPVDALLTLSFNASDIPYRPSLLSVPDVALKVKTWALRAGSELIGSTSANGELVDNLTLLGYIGLDFTGFREDLSAIFKVYYNNVDSQGIREFDASDYSPHGMILHLYSIRLIGSLAKYYTISYKVVFQDQTLKQWESNWHQNGQEIPMPGDPMNQQVTGFVIKLQRRTVPSAR